MVTGEGIPANPPMLYNKCQKISINVNCAAVFSDMPRSKSQKTTNTKDTIRSGEDVEVKTMFIQTRYLTDGNSHRGFLTAILELGL